MAKAVSAKLFNRLIVLVLLVGIIVFVLQVSFSDYRKTLLDDNYATRTEKDLQDLGDEQPVAEPVNN